MSVTTEYSRLLFKRSTVPGVVPTIPTATTIDNSWLTTDIMVGEGFLNVADDRMWFRTDNGIIEVNLSGLTGGNYFTTGATLVGNTIYFDRNDLASAYTVDLSALVVSGGTGGNYLPLSVTATTIVNVDNNDLYFTGNSASSITTAVVGGDGNDDTFAVQVNDDHALMAAQLNSGVDNFYIRASNAGASLEFDTGTTVNRFRLTKGGIHASGPSSSFNGIVYDEDYSANYTPRSLVDKQYVDGSITANTLNYLPLSGGVMSGAFTAKTISIDSMEIIKSTNGNAQIELDYFGSPGTIQITTDAGGLNEGWMYMDFSQASFGYEQTRLYTGPSIYTPITYDVFFIQGRYNTTNITEIFGFRNNFSTHKITSNTNKPSVYMASQNSRINSGVTNSAVIGGVGLTASTSNTVYVPNLNIKTIGSGTSIINLGLDSSGNVVTGTTGGASFTGGTVAGDVTFQGDVTMEDLSAKTISILNSGATTRDYFDYSSNRIESGVTNSAIIAGSGNTITSGLRNVIIAGVNLSATTNDTAYFSNVVGAPYDFAFAASDETTALTTGTTKVAFYSPRNFIVNKVKVSLTTSGSTTTTVDVNVGGTSILTAPISLSSGVFVNSTTSLVTSAITEDNRITVDIDAAGTNAAGLKVYLIGKNI
jgi:hypothetical protein